VIRIATTGGLCDIFSTSLDSGLDLEEEFIFIECLDGGLPSQCVDLMIVPVDGRCVSGYLEQCVRSAAGVKVLLVGQVDQDQLLEYIATGIRGLLPADISAELFKRALRVVSAGEVWFSREVSAQILHSFSTFVRKHEAGGKVLPVLSRREKEVMACAARGLKNKAIAEALFITESTVKTHLSRIYEKLGVENRLSAVLALKGSL